MADPEAQAWAQIGTNVAQEKQPVVPEPVASSELPTTDAEADATKAPERDEDANSEVQLHVDEDAEPFQVDDAIENEPEPETNDKEDPSTSPKGEGESQPQVPEDSKEKGPDFKDDRERSSRERDLDDDSDVPQKTNSGNPKMIRARVFVGHLNTDKAARKDVEDLFAPYGNVLGVSLQHGYGFVQYEREDEAKKAIKELHGTDFCGMRLVVDKPVALKKLLGEDPHSPAPWPGSRRDHREREYFQELDYYRRRDRELYDRYARLEELERYYYERLQAPPFPPPRRDPYYDRYADRYPPHPQAAAMPPQGLGPSPERYMDRYAADRYRPFEYEGARPRDRRYPPVGGPSYDRPRDDPYERQPLYERAERYGPPRRPM